MTLSRRSLLTLAAAPAWGRNEKPPTESGDFRQPSLTEVTRLDRTIGLDLRFATRNSFAGRPLYAWRKPSCSVPRPKPWCSLTGS